MAAGPSLRAWLVFVVIGAVVVAIGAPSLALIGFIWLHLCGRGPRLGPYRLAIALAVALFIAAMQVSHAPPRCLPVPDPLVLAVQAWGFGMDTVIVYWLAGVVTRAFDWRP